MLDVVRTIHPIGQGAFYTETLKADGREWNVVFDCGGTAGFVEKVVENYCKSLDPKQGKGRPEIDAVFISHFDDDHVNGLETLFGKANVKRIFVPLLNDVDVWAISPSFVDRLGGPSRNLLYKSLLTSAVRNSESSLEWDGQSATVVKIEKRGVMPNEADGLYLAEEPGKTRSIASGALVRPFLKSPWIFKTFNYDNSSSQRSAQLQDALKKRQITLSLSEIASRCSQQDYFGKVRDCYNSVRGSINGNSMVTYSGPTEESTSHMRTHSCCDYCAICCDWLYHFCEKAGCMYFGDYEAKGARKWKQYADDFKNQIPLLFMQQVPHHGSFYNYNLALNSEKKFNFISAGVDNRFHHPHRGVLNQLNGTGAPWVWIHEFSQPLRFGFNIWP